MGAVVLKVAGWDCYPWLRAGFSTRAGGGSSAYGVNELNLGWTREDDPETVAGNRRRFVAEVAGDDSFQLVTVRQVHGTAVRIAASVSGGLATMDGKAVLEGDGLLTREPGLLLGVQTADCVPVLIADTRTYAVMAIHAGWRGTVAGIVETGVRAIIEQGGSAPEDLIAAIGPSIGPCCFEVGEEVRAAFAERFTYADNLLSALGEGRTHLNLWEANRRQLLGVGLRTERIAVTGECTACSRLPDGKRKYFSHRAEHGVTGRMLSVIGAVSF